MNIKDYQYTIEELNSKVFGFAEEKTEVIAEAEEIIEEGKKGKKKKVKCKECDSEVSKVNEDGVCKECASSKEVTEEAAKTDEESVPVTEEVEDMFEKYDFGPGIEMALEEFFQSVKDEYKEIKSNKDFDPKDESQLRIQIKTYIRGVVNDKLKEIK